MATHTIELYKEIYDKHKHLKNAAEELDMKWQTLYWYLSKAGHPVTGDKERYGSLTDKLARDAELLFKTTIPYAIDENSTKFQAKLDYTVKGFRVDVKASCKKDGYKNNPRKGAAYRWAFSCKVQGDLADFLVCYCYSGFEADLAGDTEMILLIPKEFYKDKQSLSVSCAKSKWYDFSVSEEELKEFFDNI